MGDKDRQAAELRARCPGWGILYDPWRACWLAVRGRGELLVAESAGQLLHGIQQQQDSRPAVAFPRSAAAGRVPVWPKPVHHWGT